MTLTEKIKTQVQEGPLHFSLIDPEDQSPEEAGRLAKTAEDLGTFAMMVGGSTLASSEQVDETVKAIKEAEAYPGPSLVISYAPCIAHGIKDGMNCSVAEEEKAVDTGYWHLYRYNPELEEEGKNPFSLDSKEPKGDFEGFLLNEVRYAKLKQEFPEVAEKLFDQAAQDAKERYEAYKRLEESLEPEGE